MTLKFLNDPQNLWGTWVNLNGMRQTIVLILSGVGLLYYPAAQSLDLLQSLSTVEDEWRQRQENLIHRQRILQALQQKNEDGIQASELALQLPPINQKIRDSAQGLHIDDSRWFLESKPSLNLHLQGHFAKIKSFLTALLTREPQLALTRLQINKAEDTTEFSAQSELWLQLQPKNRKDTP